MIQSETRKAGPLVCDGVVTVFNFAFKVFSAADVQVILTSSAGVQLTLLLNSEYTVALNADQDNNPGGTITTIGASSPRPVGYTIIITSAVANTQKTKLLNGGGWAPTVVEAALDKLTILVQQIFGTVSRTLRQPISDSTVIGELPAAALRANKFLAFDATGAVLASSGPIVGVPVPALGASGRVLVDNGNGVLVFTDYTREPSNVNPNLLIDQINEGAVYNVVGAAGSVLGPDGWTGAGQLAGGTFTMQRVADPDFPHRRCLKIACTVADAAIAAGDLYQVLTAVEGYDVSEILLATSKLTLLLRTRMGVVGTYGVYVKNVAASRFIIATFTQNVANVWEDHPITFSLETGVWEDANGSALQIGVVLAGGATFQGVAGAWTGATVVTTAAQANFMSSNTNVGYITCHVIPGDVALARHRQDISRELHKAQRQYWKTFAQGVAPAQNVGSLSGSLYLRTTVAGAVGLGTAQGFPARMRAIGSLLTFNPLVANAQAGRLGGPASGTLIAGDVTDREIIVTWTADAGSAVGSEWGVHATVNARLS